MEFQQPPSAPAHDGWSRVWDRYRPSPAVASLVPVGLLALLTLLVRAGWGPLQAIDSWFVSGLHSAAVAHSGFVLVMKAASRAGSASSYWLLALALVGWLAYRSRAVNKMLFVAVAIGGSHWLNVLVKSLVDRPRPVLGDPVQHVGGLSFPSEHAQTAVVAAGVVLLVVGPALGERGRRLLAGACLAGVLTIGFSRVALGAHYPSDILGGYLLGAAWFAGLYCLFARFG